MFSIPNTIVLVHGSCHGGWCWKKLAPFLKIDNNEIYTPTLTGLGERSHLLYQKINLSTHVKDVVQLIEFQDLDDVVLIGHSYGGMVIGGVANTLPRRIKSMIFLDAYIPQDGKSAFDLVPGLKDVYAQRSLKEKDKEWLVASYTPQEFGVTAPDDINWMKSRVCPMPFHTHDEPLIIKNNKFSEIPKTFITFTDFGESMFKRTVEEKTVEEASSSSSSSDWDYYELRKGHDAIITAPKELSHLLLPLINK
jgi:pimeloyl-ACP methyl ester carboxylesterase